MAISMFPGNYFGQTHLGGPPEHGWRLGSRSSVVGGLLAVSRKAVAENIRLHSPEAGVRGWK